VAAAPDGSELATIWLNGDNESVVWLTPTK
jgi:hypothetical protein